MALSEPRILYGIHSYTPYSRSTGLPFGILRVLGGSSLALSGELNKLNGGSQRYPWAVEDGVISATISLKAKEYPDFMFELFLGKAPTANSAETSGSTTAIANVNGTSAVASTGLASATVLSGSEADVKFSKYIVKVVSATTVDVYGISNLDFARGTDKEFEDDVLKITASALTIATATPVTIPGYGIELTGGAGVIAMTIDDTAEFYVRPINTKSMDVDIGSTTDVYPEHGAIMMTQQRSNGEMFEVEAYKVKGIGLPLSAEEKAFAEPEATAEAFYDSVKDKVLSLRHVTPS